MQIWHMDPYGFGDRRMPHFSNIPPKMLTIDQLYSLAKVTHYKVDLSDTNATKKRLSRIRQERNKIATDVLILDENVIDLESKLDVLYEPAVKEDEEVFMLLDGSMYYDVEVEEDEWIRMFLERGDLIVIPKGRTFRCTTTPKNYAKVQRFATRQEPKL